MNVDQLGFWLEGQTLLVQAIGYLGFVIIALSPLAGHRRGFLTVDSIGMVPVIIHYALLDATAGAGMSVLYLALNLWILFFARMGNDHVRGLVTIAIAVAATLSWGINPLNLLALAGTMLAILARLADVYSRTLVLVVASSSGWFAYGLIVGSWSQMTFSVGYVSISLWSLWRIRQGKPPLLPEQP